MNAPTARPACWTDRCGAVASALCAVHCLLAAVLPALLASAGLAFLLAEETEWALVATAALFGSAALVHGLKRHRRWPIAAAMALGVLAIVGSRFVEGTALGALPSVDASVILVGGHLLNMRSIRSARLRTGP